MSEAERAARLQQHHEELCAAALRALAGERDLHFRGRRLYRGRQRLPLLAAHLHPTVEDDDFGGFRGAADGLALRLSRSDAALHAQRLPHAPVERLLFDLLEQFRVESLAPECLPGVAHNLRHRFEQWSRSFERTRLTETTQGMLLFTVAQICRSRVTGEPVAAATEDLMEATRDAIAPRLGHALAVLRRHRNDQAAYAEQALRLARAVATLLREAGADDGDGLPPRDADDDDAEERAAYGLLMPPDARGADAAASVHAVRRMPAEAEADGDGARYRVFTTAYDREVPAASLVRAGQLRADRERLDALIAEQRVNLPRLARTLQDLLVEPRRDDWDSGQEQGRIDGRRLARLVASPTERRLFRSERHVPAADCCVSLLLDCSGSMRQHVPIVAPLADLLARALEMAGVASEVLGFTTAAWNGGRARRDWLRAGRPAHPGRLNERLHLVFKSADTAWRRARRPMAALFRPDLYREGLDGEAVAWAAARLLDRPEAHKLLVVVSDGCPMDASTQQANDAQLLDHHLQDVVAGLDAAGSVRVHGLGVGLDLSPYYPRAQALDLSRQTGAQILRDVLRLLARHPLR